MKRTKMSVVVILIFIFLIVLGLGMLGIFCNIFSENLSDSTKDSERIRFTESEDINSLETGNGSFNMDVTIDTLCGTDPQKIKESEELLAFSIQLLEMHDYQYASRTLKKLIDHITYSQDSNSITGFLKIKASLYLSLTYIYYEKYYQAASILDECNTYFDQCYVENRTDHKLDELKKLRLYTKLALTHIYVYYENSKMASQYLAEASELIDEVSCSMLTKLFYEYERTCLYPNNTEQLEKLLSDWDKAYTQDESADYSYYAPLLRIGLAKAYLKKSPEKSFEIIENDLMSQEADFGISAMEKMHILAETYAVYAEYLEIHHDGSRKNEILSFRRTAASLFEGLMLTCYDRVVADEIYVKQTGEAYYTLAELYAELGQAEAAIDCVESALACLKETQTDAYVTLCNALKLAENLYLQIGDYEKSTECKSDLNYYKEVFPTTLSDEHPIDLDKVFNLTLN